MKQTKDVIEKHIKVKIDVLNMYDRQHDWEQINSQLTTKSFQETIVWTYSMKRLFCLVHNCIESNEPFLLVGETGTGK